MERQGSRRRQSTLPPAPSIIQAEFLLPTHLGSAVDTDKWVRQRALLELGDTHQQ
ncbi:hypothetical protein NQZ68_013597 [Dissostichus eleginoides]|nr:hypothetical protein NQZ68_013597 [Dissostichus eleginoides]